MKYIVEHPLLERSLQEVQSELRSFQKGAAISLNVDEILSSVEAMRLSLADVFPVLIGKSKIDNLPDDKTFVRMLRVKHLRCGEVMNTADYATLSSDEFKSLMIYQKDLTDLDTPSYLLIQRKKQGLELYYVQEDIANFFNRLTSLSLTISHANGDQWEYTTSNSGEDWLLNAGVEDALCKKELDWQDIDNIRFTTGFSMYFN